MKWLLLLLLLLREAIDAILRISCDLTLLLRKCLLRIELRYVVLRLTCDNLRLIVWLL